MARRTDVYLHLPTMDDWSPEAREAAARARASAAHHGQQQGYHYKKAKEGGESMRKMQPGGHYEASHLHKNAALHYAHLGNAHERGTEHRIHEENAETWGRAANNASKRLSS